MTKHLDLETLVLEKGSHEPDSRMCVMEAVAYFADKMWSDHPKCVSPVIGAFLRSWDAAGDVAGDALTPTVLALQESAFQLLDRMDRGGEGRGVIRSEEGQGLVEYALIISVVAIATITAMVFLRGQIVNIFSTIGNNLT